MRGAGEVSADGSNPSLRQDLALSCTPELSLRQVLLSVITKPSTAAPANQAYHSGAAQARWLACWAVYYFPLYAAVPLDKRALEARMWLES